ncbi:MAG: DUF3471 domain-containing protein, partial [Bacteroidales bacterium]|nr:DUF3471 domain-containing protein [Bacteroidales bacterium]
TLDVLLNAGEETDWSADLLSLISGRDERQKEARAKTEEERARDSKPTLPLEAYLGTYNCEMYGDASVYMDGDQLMVHLVPTEIFVGDLNHWQYNTWQVEFKKLPSIPPGLVNFVIDDRGEVVEMQIDVPNPDFDFTELKFFKKAE